MAALNDMRERWSARAHFLGVYIREAHAADVWPIDGPKVQEPRSTTARVETASAFQRACGLRWPLAVDGIGDEFLRAFAPWPFRLYVLRQGAEGAELVLKTSPHEGTHSLGEVEAQLRRCSR